MVAEEAAEDEDGEGAEDEDNGVGVSSTEQEAKSQGEEAGRDEKEDEGLIKKRKHWTRAHHTCTVAKNQMSIVPGHGHYQASRKDCPGSGHYQTSWKICPLWLTAIFRMDFS